MIYMSWIRYLVFVYNLNIIDYPVKFSLFDVVSDIKNH